MPRRLHFDFSFLLGIIKFRGDNGMENEGPYRSGLKPEQIEIFWNYRSLSFLVSEVNEWLRKRTGIIDVISCEFIKGHYIMLRYRERSF